VIPIVKKSSLFDDWPGLPIIAIDDWRELARSAKVGDISILLHSPSAINDCPYLWMNYWEREIREASNKCHRADSRVMAK